MAFSTAQPGPSNAVQLLVDKLLPAAERAGASRSWSTPRAGHPSIGWTALAIYDIKETLAIRAAARRQTPSLPGKAAAQGSPAFEAAAAAPWRLTQCQEPILRHYGPIRKRPWVFSAVATVDRYRLRRAIFRDKARFRTATRCTASSDGRRDLKSGTRRTEAPSFAGSSGGLWSGCRTRHAAPAAAVVLARIDEQPVTALSGALANPSEILRGQKVGSRAHDIHRIRVQAASIRNPGPLEPAGRGNDLCRRQPFAEHTRSCGEICRRRLPAMAMPKRCGNRLSQGEGAIEGSHCRSGVVAAAAAEPRPPLSEQAGATRAPRHQLIVAGEVLSVSASTACFVLAKIQACPAAVISRLYMLLFSCVSHYQPHWTRKACCAILSPVI